jgi:hypothetical protein
MERSVTSLIAIFVRMVVSVFFISCISSTLAIFHSGGSNLDRTYIFSVTAMISIDITSEPFHVCSIQYMFTIMDKKEADKAALKFPLNLSHS